jgi:hypothetical protein
MDVVLIKSALIFAGTYFIFRSASRLIRQYECDNSVTNNFKSQLCTVCMGCVGVSMACIGLNIII